MCIRDRSQPLPKRQSIKERLQTNNVLELLFRIGFASIFLTNAWVALAHPGSFLDLVEGNFASRLVGHYSLQVYAIAINDGLLGLLVLSGIKKKYVYAWAGVWLLIVTFFKITSLV
ncbi:MAG: hypothetical protein KIH63_004075, partial [Candidatus Saccharibacteria bacterium]|nr:hypothetical protein [Candidatus Saccharibacteria bacterium]